MTTATKILLVDDTAAIRRSLRTCIEAHTDWKICGEAENGKMAVDMVRQHRPDVIVIDLSMPVMNGLEAARQIGTIAPEIHILMLTLHAVPELIREAHKVGIRNVISKSDGVPATLLHAIRSVLAA